MKGTYEAKAPSWPALAQSKIMTHGSTMEDILQTQREASDTAFPLERWNCCASRIELPATMCNPRSSERCSLSEDLEVWETDEENKGTTSKCRYLSE
jgi:hypothetical protein